MTLSILLALTAGIITGYAGWLPSWFLQHLDRVIDVALFALILGVGFGLVRNRQTVTVLRQAGWTALLLPFSSMIGAILAATALAPLLGLKMIEGPLIASGFGWYSLSGVLVAGIAGTELGITAFLANLIREILAFLGIDTLYRRLGGWAAVAAGGATSMDTTLVILSQVSGGRLDALGLVSGLMHSLAVPLLIPFWAQFLGQ